MNIIILTILFMLSSISFWQIIIIIGLQLTKKKNEVNHICDRATDHKNGWRWLQVKKKKNSNKKWLSRSITVAWKMIKPAMLGELKMQKQNDNLYFYVVCMYWMMVLAFKKYKHAIVIIMPLSFSGIILQCNECFWFCWSSFSIVVVLCKWLQSER